MSDTERRAKYDWNAIRAHYDAGHSIAECKRRFGFSNGAWDAAVRRGDVRPRTGRSVRPPGVTREVVGRLLASGLSQAAIGRELGLSPATVAHHARRLEIAPRSDCARRYHWPEVQRYYDEGHSVRECQRRFGMARKTFADAVRRGAIVTRPQAIPLADLLVVGPRRNRCHVKSRLLHAGIKSARCEQCGIEDWHERPIALELHHVNGNGSDNRLENLRLLCPNCHSQTENWGGRAKTRGRLASG